MDQRDTMKNNLIANIKRLMDQLIQINDYINIYNSLQTMITDDIMRNQLNKAPAFFSITINALSHSFIMGLSCLYDKSEKADTIFTLLDKCKKSVHLFPTEKKVCIPWEDEPEKPPEIKLYSIDIEHYLKTWEKGLSELEEHICALRASRDKMYAHNDSKYFKASEKMKEDYPFKMYQIWELAEVAGTILNEMYCCLTGGTSALQSTNNNDLENLFK